MGITTDQQLIEECLYRWAREVIRSWKVPIGFKDDLQQEAVIHALRKIGKYREMPGKTFEAWAKVVMTNRVRTLVKRERAHSQSTVRLYDQDGHERLILDRDSARFDDESDLLRVEQGFDFARELQIHWDSIASRLIPAERRVGQIFLDNPDASRSSIAKKARVRNVGAAYSHLSHIKQKLKTLINTDVQGTEFTQ